MRAPCLHLLLSFALFAAAAARSNHIFSVGSSHPEGPLACGPGFIGLVDADTAKWINGSCIAAAWAGDAETATTLESGAVVVYVNAGMGADTYLYTVDFPSKNVSRCVLFGFVLVRVRVSCCA